ncbi:hypothetical protein EDD11_004074 [Mortierella claussenii]|nr:hypothetical protein EDD11_004074 [Mortierella claussenii]
MALTCVAIHGLGLNLVIPIDQDLQNRWFDFGGDAIVNTNKHIRLTQDMPSQSGWLWSRLPMTAPNFEVEFEFKVEGKGDGIVGDGFAVWLTKERAESGDVFGNRDRFEGLGIFFDTYANARSAHTFPYVMAMLGDGRATYDNDNDGLANSIGGCEADFRGKDVPTKARISYSSDSQHLKLQLQTQEWDQWHDCFSLSDVKLPPAFYLGFSAITGEVHDNHDIISVTTKVLAKGEDFASQKRNNTPPPSAKAGFGWVIKFLAGSGVFVGLIVVVMKMSKKNDMKRIHSMKLTPTSITLFLVQIGTLLSGLIVAICCGLYASSYPKSPEAGSLSAIACGTLAFAVLSTLVTAILILRQKYGKTMRAAIESVWVIFATAMWVLAAIGGIAQPANGMSNVSCKVLPSGKETDDANYKRACQSMFASTAFCIMTALFYIATAILFFVYSIKSSYRERKARKTTVGGHYKLSMTPSQYRRQEKETEESKTLKGAGEHEEQQEFKDEEESHGGRVADGHFSENVYRDPVISSVPATLATPSTTYSTNNASSYENPYVVAELNIQHQQQQQQQHQYLQQQQSSWNQQPAYAPF